MIIHFEALFAPYAEAAVTRLGYTRPAATFTVDGLSIRVDGDLGDELELRRDVLYQLYREKIYQEGLPARSLMYEALLS